MYTTTTLLVAAATLASAAFDPAAKTNVITYWGQGYNQDRLLTTCQNPAYDIINIGFVNVFPDQGPGGWPGTNFGNACWGDVYEHNGVNTSLLKTCPDIGPDVIACQQTYGKKILLSLGGAYPADYYIKNDRSGRKFADFLWAAFGPVSASKPNIPRPWGDAGVDGFDFDIESIQDLAPQENYQSSGYAAMITRFKKTLFPQDPSKDYYISGAPQCPIPDSHLSDVLAKAWFDFFTIQFYNTPGCSARDGVKKGGPDISYFTWTKQKSLNPKVKMSIGIPGDETAARDPSYYLKPGEAQKLVRRFWRNKRFGGIMVWEATAAQENTPCDVDYGTWMKEILQARAAGTSLNANLKTCAGAPSKRSLQPRQDPVYGGEVAVTTVVATVTSYYAGSIPPSPPAAYRETSVETSAHAAPSETWSAAAYPGPESTGAPVSTYSPQPMEYAPSSPESSSVESTSAPPTSNPSSPSGTTPAPASMTSGPASQSVYTSYNTITVIPVPASSTGYNSTAPSSSSAPPVPATGGSGKRRAGGMGVGVALMAIGWGLVV